MSEEKYRNILESIEEGYFETDLRDNLIFFNAPLARILGYSIAELQGKNTRNFTTPEAAAAAEAALEKVVKTGEAASVADYKVIQKDGEPKDLELSVSLIKDTEGRPTGFRGVVRDVSERKRAEADRKKLEAQLRKRRKWRPSGRSPAASPTTSTTSSWASRGKCLADAVADRASAGHRAHSRASRSMSRAAATLSRQLLGFARRGKYKVKAPTSTTSSEVLGDVRRTKKEIRVYTQLAPEVPGRCSTDRGQIEQVFSTCASTRGRPCPTEASST